MFFKAKMSAFLVRYCISLMGACVVALVVAKYVILMDRQSVAARISTIEAAIDYSDKGLAGALADVYAANSTATIGIKNMVSSLELDMSELKTSVASNRQFMVAADNPEPQVMPDLDPKFEKLSAEITKVSGEIEALKTQMQNLEGALYAITVSVD